MGRAHGASGTFVCRKYLSAKKAQTQVGAKQATGKMSASTKAVRLDPQQVQTMVEQVTAGRSLPVDLMQQIVTKTDGVPLFVEELTKAVLEAGILIEDAEGYRLDGPLPPLAIPATLHDSLMARLDHLASVKEIAQVGAAIGREFKYGLLHGGCPR